MNVKIKDLDKVKEVMPSMGGLTISEVLSNLKKDKEAKKDKNKNSNNYYQHIFFICFKIYPSF